MIVLSDKMKLLMITVFLTVFSISCDSSNGGTSTVTTPDTPQNFEAVSGDRSVIARWDPVTGAEKYEVYMSIADNSADDNITVTSSAINNRAVNNNFQLISTTNKESYRIDPLINDQAYHIKVVVTNGEGTSSSTEIIEAKPVTATAKPDTPIFKNIHVGNNRAELSWSYMPQAHSYGIYLSTDNEAFTHLDNVVESEYVISGLSKNKTYYVRINAVNRIGSSDNLKLAFKTSEVLAVPAVPKNIVATPLNAAASLFWTISDNSTYTLVYSSESLDGEYAVAGSTYNNHYLVEGLANNKIYYFKVAAANSLGLGEQSQTYSAMPLAIYANNLVAPAVVEANPLHGTISLSWRSVPNADKYDVYMNNSRSSDYTFMTSTLNSNYIVKGLADNVTYSFHIIAKNSTASSVPSKTLTATILKPQEIPLSPYAIHVVTTGSKIHLKWATQKDALSYNIYRDNGTDITRNVRAGLVKHISTTSKNNVIDIELEKGKEYTYHLEAVNDIGVSEKSATFTAKLTDSTVVPPSPQGINTIDMGSYILVSWNSIIFANHYDIYLSDTVDGTYENYRSVAHPTDKIYGLEHDKTYYFKVKAVNNAGASEFSDLGTVFFENPQSVPEPPSAITANTIDHQVILHWNLSQTADLYTIYYSENETGEYRPVLSTSTLDATLTFKDYRTYYVKIVASNSRGDSTFSDVLPFELIRADKVPDKVTNLTARTQSMFIIINWDHSDYAIGYKVYYKLNTDTEFVDSLSGRYEKEVAFIDVSEKETFRYDKTYDFAVKGVNSVGESDNFSNIATATPIGGIKPTPVQELVAEGLYQQVSLRWLPANNAQTYTVYGAKKGDKLEKLAVVLHSRFNHIGYDNANLEDAATYKYKVIAYNGLVSSDDSRVVEATTLPEKVPPPKPNILNISTGETSASVLIENISEATSYDIHVETDGESPIMFNVEHRNTIIPDLKHNTTYKIKARAVNSSGKSEYSNIVTVKTNEIIVLPGDITDLDVTDKSGGSIEMKWAKIPNADYYFMYAKGPAFGTKYKLMWMSVVNTMRYSSLGPGKYSFKVKYYISDVSSGFSNIVEVEISR